MPQDLERVRRRLENIRSVRPILLALRTISLGSWQMALNRREGVGRYSERLLRLLPLLLSQLGAARSGGGLPRWTARWTPWSSASPGGGAAGRVVALLVGSERGLCGRYNATVLDRADAYRTRRADEGVDVVLVGMGSRLIRASASRAYELDETQPLPVTTLPSFDLALRWGRRWLQAYGAFELDAVDVIYNAYESAGRYRPEVARLLPPSLPEGTTPGGVAAATSPTIVETNPQRLYARVVVQWTLLRLYDLLLEAAASEHSARFQLMESAAKNTDRLVADLTSEVQSARREAITREMQELAVGSGLLER